MNWKYLPSFSRFFSPSVIKELACCGKSDFVNYTIQKSGYDKVICSGIDYRALFDAVYGYLRGNYRSEYIYKNAITNKILLGRHSLNTSTLLSEFRVGTCKADVAILNGTSHVYEIKTELDGLDRLENQLKEYKKVFDKRYVVTCPQNVEKVSGKIDEGVGIIVLTDSYTLPVIREPVSNRESVEPKTVFDSLRKHEYCQIIEERFGELPDVPNTRIFRESKKMFSQLSPAEAHDSMVGVLKKRSCKKEFKDFVLSMPHSLKLASITSGLSSKERTQFQQLLQNSVNC